MACNNAVYQNNNWTPTKQGSSNTSSASPDEHSALELGNSK